MKLYGVLGNPIAHSKSPMIHTMFAKMCDVELDYQAYCLTIGNFEADLNALIDQGLQGANVTVPFKEGAYHFANELTIEALDASAVNTLSFRQNKVVGHNTDGNGLLNDLIHRHHIELQNQRILVLGAGGASKGIVGPLLRIKPDEIIISNRTFSKAEQLANNFKDQGAIIACEWDKLQGQFDVIINATSSSLNNEFTVLPCDIDQYTIGYDLMYSNVPTTFMDYMVGRGARSVHDGLGMLVEQAALSFEFWHGIRLETEMVYQALR